MRTLRLVKTLTHLKEEKKHQEEIRLVPVGIELTRGELTEIAGEQSSGKTSLVLSLLAGLTRSSEICAVVDSANTFDPCSAITCGVELENLLWIRCGGDLEKAFMSADYLVQAKGFGIVWLNLNGLSKRELRMVPKTYWYRYRTRIKETPTLILVTSEEPVTGSASQQAFVAKHKNVEWLGKGRYKLLKEIYFDLHSRKKLYAAPLSSKIEFDHAEINP